MSDQQSSYRQIFKATSLFGGVQVVTILVTLVKAKFVALLLGATGFGINSLLNNTVLFIASITGLGIAFSAVRDISEAHSTQNDQRLSNTIIAFRRWCWFTGLLGLTSLIVLSPFLSEFSFSNEDYTWSFIILSVIMLINSINLGQTALLRGTMRYSETAKATIFGNVLGLCFSVGLYYSMGVKGIVPALIATSLMTLLSSYHYSRKVPILKVNQSLRESYQIGKPFVKLGIAMTFTGLVTYGITYLISAFVQWHSGLEAVGLYNAGWGITNQYVSLIFTAMAVDYFPRLSAIHTDNKKVREAVNQQTEIMLLIITPILLLMLLSLPVLIPLLLSKQFLSVIPFTQWIVVGMVLKATSWALGFVLLAKGDTKLFFITETICGFLVLIGTITGYSLWGLEGVGVGFVIWYSVYLLLMVYIVYKKYEFSYSIQSKKILLYSVIISILAFIAIKFLPPVLGYLITGAIFMFTGFYSTKALNKLMNLKEVYNKIIKKIKR